MKGKVSFYYNAPNLAQVKSRLELGKGEDSKTKEFTAKMREVIQETLGEVLNEQILNIRSKAIAKFQAAGFTVKSDKHAADLANPLNAFFDVVVSATPFPSDAKDADNDGDAGDVVGDSPAQNEEGDGDSNAPADKPASKKPADKKPADKPASKKEEDPDEFED